jgi:DNA-binding response OmpR family regulator
MAKIFLADDDEFEADKLRKWLVHERYTVDVTHNGNDAIAYLLANEYDCVILDWMMPGKDGLTLLKEYRNSHGSAPVLMLTGRSTLSDKEAGLDSGADDYLTKPFELRELSARLRALLRRPKPLSGTNLTAGVLTLDTARRRVTKDGLELQLQPIEFALLELFMRHPNHTFSHQALAERVWPTDSEPSVQGLRTYIKLLRKKIDEEGKPSLIKTMHSVGYCLELD